MDGYNGPLTAKHNLFGSWLASAHESCVSLRLRPTNTRIQRRSAPCPSQQASPCPAHIAAKAPDDKGLRTLMTSSPDRVHHS
ncbi:hypothetical protein BS50DRAFT_579318 [Corynespora cassiicola Philippines]|uniref:Uncharacterized protein n=1 Tax=Corynespora cassiicola Philippines TaxID=1448308 RepID=A0A2T2N435_CORCC|nr:hypothetical protein BS50DRAFT_579318 [Corynespora cassiicola Philippines]